MKTTITPNQRNTLDRLAQAAADLAIVRATLTEAMAAELGLTESDGKWQVLIAYVLYGAREELDELLAELGVEVGNEGERE